jgi:hypothetical protein
MAASRNPLDDLRETLGNPRTRLARLCGTDAIREVHEAGDGLT